MATKIRFFFVLSFVLFSNLSEAFHERSRLDQIDDTCMRLENTRCQDLWESEIISESEILSESPLTAEASYCLGLMYEEANQLPQSYEGALYWYIKSAEDGFVLAQYKVGDYYQKGLGFKSTNKDKMKNLAIAETWHEKAARKGYLKSQYQLGEINFMYGLRNSLSGGYLLARKWWLLVAENGDDHRAQERLGFMSEEGRGLEANITDAVHWYRKAASQNNTRAQVSLGVLFESHDQNHTVLEMDGFTTKKIKNQTLAKYWFQRAAALGNPAAEYNLATMDLIKRPLCSSCAVARRMR